MNVRATPRLVVHRMWKISVASHVISQGLKNGRKRKSLHGFLKIREKGYKNQKNKIELVHKDAEVSNHIILFR